MSAAASPSAFPASSAVAEAIRGRTSTNVFDSTHRLSDAEIDALVALATRAPTAFNLQNWHFVAVRTSEAKQRLRALAYDQEKVTQAAVTFIVCGELPEAGSLPARLQPFVAAGHMPATMPEAWVGMASGMYADPVAARDEAIRSASLGAATLMLAAAGQGLASGPMIGFDAAGVAQAFGLSTGRIPAMLVTIGRAAAGNWPQKPRRPVAEVLTRA